MGFSLSDPLGTKRRGRKKQRAAEEAATQTRAVGEDLFGDKGLLASSQATASTNMQDLRGRVSGTLADSASRATAALDTAETGAVSRFSTARDEISSLFGEARSTFNPFIKTGQEASQTLSQALGLGGQTFDPSFLASTPGYQHRLQQGQEALISGEAAAGLTDSSKTRQGLMKFGQGLAGESFDTFISQLLQTSGQGASAAGTAGQLTSNQAQLTGNLFTGEADTLTRLGMNRADIAQQTGQQQTSLDLGITSAINASELSTANTRTTGLLGTRTGAINAELAGQMASINAAGENVAQMIDLAKTVGSAVATGGTSLAIPKLPKMGGAVAPTSQEGLDAGIMF